MTSKHVTNFAGDCASTCPACSEVVKAQQRLRAALSLVGECLSRGYWKIGTELTQRANAAIIEALSGDSPSPVETTRDDDDAARYRYLKGHLGLGWGVKLAGADPHGFAGPTLLDEALDAARGAVIDSYGCTGCRSTPCICSQLEPTRELSASEAASFDKAFANSPRRVEPSEQHLTGGVPVGQFVASLIVSAEEAKQPLAFRHWSKDPLIPYANCHCDTCLPLNGSGDDAKV